MLLYSVEPPSEDDYSKQLQIEYYSKYLYRNGVVGVGGGGGGGTHNKLARPS